MRRGDLTSHLNVWYGRGTASGEQQQGDGPSGSHEKDVKGPRPNRVERGGTVNRRYSRSAIVNCHQHHDSEPTYDRHSGSPLSEGYYVSRITSSLPVPRPVKVCPFQVLQPISSLSPIHKKTVRHTLRKSNTIQICPPNPRFVYRLFHDPHNPFPVMSSRITRQKPFPWWCDVRMPDIG
jgi:hypothetical protein